MEYDGLEAKGFRIIIEIEPTGLYPVTEVFTHDQALTLPSHILELISPLIPSEWVATAKVKGLVG
jgi:hypothetical protein